MKVTGSSIEQLEKDRPRKKCRKWRLWVSTDSGRKSRRFAGTYTEAQEALRRLESDLEGFAPASGTFGAYAASWRLYRANSGNYAPNTIANDLRNENAVKRTYLWDMELAKITPADCRDAMQRMRDDPAGGSRLSGTTMNKLHGYISQVFSQAVKDGTVSKNPMDALKPPKVDTKEKKALTRVEIHETLDMLAAREPDAHVMAVYLMLLLGLRRGEALALLDSDVSGGFVHVHQAVKERDGSIAEPKSKAGVRTLPIPKPLAEPIERWRAERERRNLSDAPTLCCNAYGGVMRPQNMQKWWDAHSCEFGCAGYTMHELRHTNLTIVARHMSPFDLQRYAGWSSIAPARIYIHDDLDSVSRAISEAW